MELRYVCESEETKNDEGASDLDHEELEVESSGTTIGSGRKSGGPKVSGHSVLNSVNKIMSQIKKPQHRRSGSPLNWFPRKKNDSYLKRKIRNLQENEGMNLSLDETLGNANPHYTRIAREKIAAREAARKAMEARKAAMVEASWCRVLRAARIQSKEAETELEKAEKNATESFEAARAKGVMMYDKPDSSRRPCKVESHSSIGGKSTHMVTASFETAFDVDKEVMAAIKRAFIQLANNPPSSNKEEFKDLLWKISQNPDNSETEPEISSESEFDVKFGSDNEVNTQVTEKKHKSNCRQLPSDHDKRSAKSFTELVSVMLDRLKGLQEDELASLATIVATCGLNAALLELEHSKEYEQGTRGARGDSFATRFMEGYSNRKETVTEVPSLDKFLVKHVSRLEREVQEARNSRCQHAPRTSEVINTEAKSTLIEPFSDLGSILVKHVSKLEKEIQEAKKSHKEKTDVLSGRTLHAIVSSNKDKENIDSNMLTVLFVATEGEHQAGKLTETNDRTPFGTENELDLEHMKQSPVKHISRLERAKLEALNSFSSQEQTSLDKLLVKPMHRLEREKMQALERGTYTMKRDQQKHGADVTAVESLDKVLVKHDSMLEKEKMASRIEYDPTEGEHQAGKLTETNDRTPLGTENELELEHMKQSPVKHISRLERAKQEALNSFSSQEQTSLDKLLVKPMHRLEREKMRALERGTYTMKRDQQKHGADVMAVESLDKVLVKHDSMLEKEKMASRIEYDPISTVKIGEKQPEKLESLDESFVRHQSKLEKAKLAASQQPVYDIIKHRKQTEVAASDSLDRILVMHQPKLEKVKLAAAQQSDDYTKYSDSRKQARERELQETWGGLSLGNSIRPHLSRLERDRAAWKRAEDEERMLAK